MATLDVGSARGRRRVDHDLPLVPFIDFLLCIVALLLVTAVWTRMARMDTSAVVPGDPSRPSQQPVASLHVTPRGGDRFVLSWRRGATVLTRDEIVAPVLGRDDGSLSRPALAEAVERSCKDHGAHRASGDLGHDTAVVHAPQSAPFSETVAVLDALYSLHRPVSGPSGPARRRAFVASFATD